MSHSFIAAAALGTVILATPALATNELTIVSDNLTANSALLDVSGDLNLLQVTQNYDGLGGANAIGLSITGDFNGGPAGAQFTGAALSVGLQPGTIVQDGHANAMDISVAGSGNLFAFAQHGSENILNAAITGSGNQAAVLQMGVGNVLSFTQNGSGNTISVTQRSW